MHAHERRTSRNTAEKSGILQLLKWSYEGKSENSTEKAMHQVNVC